MQSDPKTFYRRRLPHYQPPNWLQDPTIAELVAAAIYFRDASLYRILQSLKSYTARESNALIGRSGAFWHHESYDRVVRDEAELEKTIRYILDNPVKAGLCKRWRDWKRTYLKAGMVEL